MSADRARFCLQMDRLWLAAMVMMAVGTSGVLGPAARRSASRSPAGAAGQVKPTYTEPGLPQLRFRLQAGRCSAGRPTQAVAAATGARIRARAGSTAGSGDAYNSMMSQSWGSSAANAGAMGVSDALAATCAMESNCQNVGSSGEQCDRGVQMISSTYNAISRARWRTILASPGQLSPEVREMDPGTEAYAAAYELRQDAINLQNNANISNPTVLDVRAIYQFGSGAGPGVAEAPDDANIAQLTGLSAASLAANGLNSSSTVGQWRETIISKLGSATASQSVLQQ